jgi:hypothetical protein
MKSLFGDEIPDEPLHMRRDIAHAAPVGTGPEGETCRNCRHYTRIEYGRVYLKCGLMRVYWTHGPGTDIRAKDAACRKFEPAREEQCT